MSQLIQIKSYLVEAISVKHCLIEEKYFVLGFRLILGRKALV